MKHLSILLPVGQANLMKIVGARELFEVANHHFTSTGRKAQFKIQFVGCLDSHEFASGSLTIKPEMHFHSLARTDLIVIPAMDDSFEEVISNNRRLIEWIAEQYKQGAQIASLCTGAFLLAATGLLDKKQCATHWWAADAFRKMFPDVRLAIEKIITDENGIYTSGGSFSAFNLLLHIIEKFYDRETAVGCAKGLELDMDRNSQSYFMIFSGQKDHHDQDIKDIQNFIEENVGEKVSVESLADKFAINKRNLERRFKKATGNTPVEYIQRVKIESAKKNLETGRKNVNDVMYDVGYGDVKAFRKIFKKITGLSPIEYKRKYNNTQIS
jgi:transcriptional regulator GlxA family with amidase domain